MSRTHGKEMSFDAHPPRELPVPAGAGFRSLAGEIAALLNRHGQSLRTLQAKHEGELQGVVKAVARAAQIVFHLERAVGDAEAPLADSGLGRVHTRLRIIKDQLKSQLAAAGFAWSDPTGQEFAGELAERVEVDGWRHAADYDREVVAETREAIVLFQGRVVLPGAVVVGAPAEPAQAAYQPNEDNGRETEHGG